MTDLSAAVDVGRWDMQGEETFRQEDSYTYFPKHKTLPISILSSLPHLAYHAPLLPNGSLPHPE